MKSLLGVIPHEFTEYWISRFPRLLSHSYHALEACSKENSFLPYYPTTYVFSKPAYFTEITEDFVPSEQPKLNRDSPKKYNKDNRYNNKYHNDRRPSPHDIENVGPNPAYRNFNRPQPGFENFTKSNKKGAYNFHRYGENVVGAQQQLSPNQPSVLRPGSPIQRPDSPIQRSSSPVQQAPSPAPPPPPPESKYVEDADGFVLVKPKHNNANLRHRKSDASKAATNDDANIAWTLSK